MWVGVGVDSPVGAGRQGNLALVRRQPREDAESQDSSRSMRMLLWKLYVSFPTLVREGGPALKPHYRL